MEGGERDEGVIREVNAYTIISLCYVHTHLTHHTHTVKLLEEYLSPQAVK